MNIIGRKCKLTITQCNNMHEKIMHIRLAENELHFSCNTSAKL